MNYKATHSLHDRWSEASRIIEKYPDRVPIICERSHLASKDCPHIDKNKYLIPNDLTVGQFIYVLRKRMKLPPEKALFLFVNGTIIPTSHMMCQIYDAYKDEDCFLYITCSYENTFG